MTEYILSEEFLVEYRKMAAEFDKLAKDLFQGAQLEQLALEFLRKHHSYIRQFPFIWKSRFPNISNSESINEDLEILNEDMGKNDEDQSDSSSNSANVIKSSEYAQVIGDIYRRVSEGSYLRLTFNKSRHNQEEDRLEPVDWARYALRYDYRSNLVCYWYAVGEYDL